MSHCPAEDKLRGFLHGNLPAGEQNLVDSHLEGCVTCQLRAEAFLQSTPLGQVATSLQHPGLVTPPPPAEPSAIVEQWPEQIGAYAVVGELGRGGMGVVLRVKDPKFKRPLALKLLLAKFEGQANLRKRFLEEAQIMGQLQHPGIPPVQDLGQLPDGRPFLVMKLIRGQTMAALRAKADPRLLNIFEQVCQTIAYAHSRGIIHRDLKPSNVMVGAFGEVQVMDWGLAKLVSPIGADDCPAPGGIQPESTIYSVRMADSDSGTQPGMALGTPAYMPPEQARGEVERLDARCDVFGLGAILCEILTGKPAFAGRNSLENHRLAMKGDLSDAFARLDACGQDKQLIALAKRCLAPELENRPSAADAVAKEIAAYQAAVQDRLRQAELARAQAEIRAAEERKRRKLHLALAASVLLLLGLAGGAGWWLLQQDAEQQRQDLLRAEEKKLDQARTELLVGQAKREQEVIRAEEKKGEEQRNVAAATTAVEQGHQLQAKYFYPQADKAFRQALQLLGPTGDAKLRQDVQTALANLALVVKLDRVRQTREHIVDTPENENLNFAGVPKATAAVFKEIGWNFETDSDADLVQRLTASAVRHDLVAAIDDWAVEERNPILKKRLWLITAKVTGQGWRAGMEETLKDRKKMELMLAQVPMEEMTGTMIAGFCSNLRVRGGDPIALLERARLRLPNDFWVWFQLGYAWRELGNQYATQSADAFATCLAMRPDSAPVRCYLGSALRAKGDMQEAIRLFGEAVQLDPKYGKPYEELAMTLRIKGDVEGALAILKDNARVNATRPASHAVLGETLFRHGRFGEAILALERVLELPRQQGINYAVVQDQIKKCHNFLALETKLPAALAGEIADPPVLLALAQLCQNYHARYRDAVYLYSAALNADPKLADDFTRGWRWNAARCAIMAAAGKSQEKAPLAKDDKTKLRQQGLDWLRADLDLRKKLVAANDASAAISTAEQVSLWVRAAEVAAVRENNGLASLALEEQAAWRKLWAGFAEVITTAQACFKATRYQGTLTKDKQGVKYAVKMAANKRYIIDMQSSVFDTFLRLEDANGKLLEENDDIDTQGGNTNSRIDFTSPTGGSFWVIATSFEQQGVGSYILIIREFGGNVEKRGPGVEAVWYDRTMSSGRRAVSLFPGGLQSGP